MKAVCYSELRKNLKSLMDGIAEDHESMIITRRNAANMVLMSYEDYSAIEETLYLAGSSANARRIRESIQSFNENKGKQKNLIEENE
jgi:antitoxin YefM